MVTGFSFLCQVIDRLIYHIWKWSGCLEKCGQEWTLTFINPGCTCKGQLIGYAIFIYMIYPD